MGATSAAGSGVVVPVKAFRAAKLRLAGALDAAQRIALARAMAGRVVAAADPLPVTVVCDDPEVAAWAESVGARTLWTPGLGLDGAVSAGVDALVAEGTARVMVAHADLPAATGLAALARSQVDGVTLVPDRRNDGTNVIIVPADARFEFSYGPGSFGRHRVEATRLGLGVHVVRDAALAWDIDVPDDLDAPPGLAAGALDLEAAAGPARR